MVENIIQRIHKWFYVRQSRRYHAWARAKDLELDRLEREVTMAEIKYAGGQS